MQPSPHLKLLQTRLEVATLALKLARGDLPYKSSNKSKLLTLSANATPDDNAFQHHVEQISGTTARINNARYSWAGKPFWLSWARGYLSFSEIKAYAQAVRKEGAGNCSEHAILALDYLLTVNASNLELVVLAEPSNHVFIVLGSSRPMGRLYRPGFIQLPPTSVICDPWAKIACAAITYEQFWNKKMTRWVQRGKHIFVGNDYFGQAVHGQLSPRQYQLNLPQKVLFSIK